MKSKKKIKCISENNLETETTYSRLLLKITIMIISSLVNYVTFRRMGLLGSNKAN